MVPKPRMMVYAPRAVVRHSVEMGLKQLGIMEFVDEMMEAELNEKINKLMDTLLQKFTVGSINFNLRIIDNLHKLGMTMPFLQTSSCNCLL